MRHMARLIDASEPLQRLIEQLGITQAELAQAAEVTPVTANRWVNGKQLADARTVVRAFDRLGEDPTAYGVERPRRSPGAPGQTSDEAPPAWATALDAKLDTIIDLLEHSR